MVKIIIGVTCVALGVIIGGIIVPWGPTVNSILSSDYLLSTTLSLCALSLTLWQGYLTRKHNRLSTRPHLTLNSHLFVNGTFYAVDLKNDGLGPAFIKSISVFFDGEQLEPGNTCIFD